MEKFQQVSAISKLISLAAVLSIFVGVFGFGYGWTGTHGGFHTTDENDYDPTVSYAIGNGLKPAIVSLISIGALLAIYTLYLRKGRYAVLRYLTVGLILGLLIAITYVNPTINGKAYSNDVNRDHYILAVTAFTVTLIFNLFTYYLLYKNYSSNMVLFILLGLINFGIYLGMYVIVYLVKNENSFFYPGLSNNDKNKNLANLGAGAEIVQILFFLLTILFMGFYKSTAINTKSKNSVSLKSNKLKL